MNWEQRHTLCRERALARCPGEDMTMSDCSESTVLTLTVAHHLADLFAAQERHDRLYWYPSGAENGAPCGSYVIRSFTHEGGNLWFDKDGDVRDAYLWLSGIGELWLKVSDIVRALENVIDARYGSGEPMCRMERRDA